MGTIRGTLGVVSKDRSSDHWPVSRDVSAVCPKSVPIRSQRSAGTGLWTSLRVMALASRRPFFQPESSQVRLHKKILRIHKCLRRVYLQMRGEVAERLKAVVC